MKGKWAAGIPPRNFHWVIRDRLAVSERPGGFAANHRRVRRHEEILWLRAQGFDRIVSLLPAPYNVQAYEEQQLDAANHPLAAGVDPRPVLADLLKDLADSLAQGHRVLVHQDELGDRTMGAVAGFLVWSSRAASGAQGTWLMERLVGRQMGSIGRELVVAADELDRPGT